ncbi:MAG TPA: hypothetical protein VEW68_03005 [Patescibacteria group bacterium]|nr:hypothetical protein [Patescibacteria group bacterium]
MLEVIPPEGATEEQVEAFVASLRADSRAHVRELLASGASETEIEDYLASLEPVPADALPGDGGRR